MYVNSNISRIVYTCSTTILHSINQKYIVLTKIDICSSWNRKSLSLFFQCCKWRKVEHEKYSTVLIHFRQREKVILRLSWQVAWLPGSVSQQSIDWHKQIFYFKHFCMDFPAEILFVQQVFHLQCLFFF